MKSVTYTQGVTVMIADVDGRAIAPGSVLRALDDGKIGIVEAVIDFEKPAEVRRYDYDGPVEHGDLIIWFSPGIRRVTNHYCNWRHVPRAEQTYWQRFKSWFYTKFEYDEEYDPGGSEDEFMAIQGMLSILPEDPEAGDDAPIIYNTEEAVALLAEHLDELTKEEHD